MSAKLSTNKVSVSYGKVAVLHDVSVVAKAGKITCILGANGAGKTTLIKAILGLLPVDRGNVQIDIDEMTEIPAHLRVAFGLGCVPEGRKIFPKMTVEENLRVGAYLIKDEREIKTRMEKVFEVFPRLQERRSQLGGTMSGGEQAMVSIGRALMAGPRIILIDEPSLGLSPALVKDSFNVIKNINRQGVTVLLVEQNVHQTLEISDYGYVLGQGRVLAEGTPDELTENPDVQRAYFGT